MVGTLLNTERVTEIEVIAGRSKTWFDIYKKSSLKRAKSIPNHTNKQQTTSRLQLIWKV